MAADRHGQKDMETGLVSVILDSQDDALFLQAYEAYEARAEEETSRGAEVEYNTFGDTESQELALYLACEEYEKQAASAAITTVTLSTGPSTSSVSTNTAETSNSETEAPEEDLPLPGDADPNCKSISKYKIVLPDLSFIYMGGYLTVTNLVSQLWCEQQMQYGYRAPKIDTVDTPAMAAGNKIHKERDYEVNKYVKVKAKTREDKYAIRLLNVISHLKSLLLLGKRCVREIPIFGVPLGQGFLVVGTIDELRFDSLDRLELVEFKTRGNTLMPVGKAQMQGYKMQMMLYKQMVDELVIGRVDGELVLLQLDLEPDHVLDDELLLLVQGKGEDCVTLGQLMKTALQQFRFLPYVQVLTLEISSQTSGKIVAKETVEFDFNWLQGSVHHCFEYWKGHREAEGVDIEDAWKCRSCLFYEDCEWREKMNQIYAKKNCLSKVQGRQKGATV